MGSPDYKNQPVTYFYFATTRVIIYTKDITAGTEIVYEHLLGTIRVFQFIPALPTASKSRWISFFLCRSLRLFERASVFEHIGNLHLGQSVLARAEKFARTAQLEVFVRDFEAVRCSLHDLHSPLRRVVFGVRDEDAGGFILPTPDSPSKLMQLRKPEALGVFNNHNHGVRHVNADFDDRRRDEQLCFAI